MPYLDYAASAPLRAEALAAMLPLLERPAANPSSQHGQGRAARAAVETAREQVAALVGAAPAEVVFTSGGTEADNLAVKGALLGRPAQDRHLVCSAVEHHAVLDAAAWAEADAGARVALAPVTPDGRVDLERLAVLLEPGRTALVAVMAANNEVGTGQPVAAVADLAHAAGAVLLCDAVQAAGLPGVDLAGDGIDLLALAAAGCGADDKPTLPQGSDPIELDASDFTPQIDHPFFPMRAGSKWVYEEKDVDGSVQRVEVTVTDRTKTITGIEARVVHDIVTEDGQVKEDTFDWYAQDKAGNLWYLGEDTKEYEDGRVSSTKGSWEAGLDGALAGILLPAEPEVGVAYRQEYYEGQAEDAAQVLSLDMRAKVPAGLFDQVLVTKDYTPLEPNLLEHKFYAPGVGLVLAITVKGGSSRAELLRYAP